MNPKIKSEFAMMCRALRVEKNLKQREVAQVIGVKLSTYGNVESSQYKVINRNKAFRLAEFYRLSPDRAAKLLDAWDACPLSPGGEVRRERWKLINERRAKAKNHDRMKLNLIELLGCRLMDIPDEQLCECSFGEPLCVTCAALDALALPPYTASDREKLFDQLHREREKLLAPPPERP